MDIDKIKELRRLDFEDIIWIVFIILAILDIIGDHYQKKSIINDNPNDEECANNIFTIIVIITIIINLYFLSRSYNLYKESSNKSLAGVKLTGSIFLILGSICLLYFQVNNKSDNIGGPDL